MRHTIGLVAVAAALTITATAGAQESTTVTLVTHDSFAVSDDVLSAFTAETGIGVEIFRAGDAGQMVNQLILTRDNPVGDVAFGIDNTFLSRGLDAGLFDPYRSPLLDNVDPELIATPDGRVTPIDFGDVCLNYDKGALAATGTPPPSSLRDLTDERYRGMLVVENPASSSPGLAFLLATIARFPDGADYSWRDFWKDLVDNDVLVTPGWEEAYFGAFTFGGGGDRPLVVSYASSPPAEIVFAEGEPPAEVSTGVIEDGCFRQIEYAGILAGTDQPLASRRLIDFMLSEPFQEDMPFNMFVFPVNGNAQIPAEFLDNTLIPTSPLTIDAAAIEANREVWIEAWTGIVNEGGGGGIPPVLIAAVVVGLGGTAAWLARRRYRRRAPTP